MHKQISSLQNPTVKRLLRLQEKSRNRRKEELFLVEGIRETELAKVGGYAVETVYNRPDLFATKQLISLGFPEERIVEITREVYQKIAYRGGTEGILTLFKSKAHHLENIRFQTKNPLVLVAEAPEKPGNIGALLRTADAANLDAVLIANPKTDLYNPNIIRSSVGCVFTNQVGLGSTSEIITFLKTAGFQIYSAALQNAKPYTQQNYTGATAIVVGTEADGLQSKWLKNCTEIIKIPMQGKIDSMNVSVAAGILIFEAKRQRELKI